MSRTIAKRTYNKHKEHEVPFVVDRDEPQDLDEIKYLRLLKTANNDTSKEIQTRIHAGNRAYGLRNTLTSNRVQRCTKLVMYKTLVRPVVLYDHETWTLLAEDERALIDFERKAHEPRTTHTT